jgi:hypothetical protein
MFGIIGWKATARKKQLVRIQQRDVADHAREGQDSLSNYDGAAAYHHHLDYTGICR